MLRTLGTSWCILLKKKSYYQAQRYYSIEGSYILVDLCELAFYWRCKKYRLTETALN